MNTTTTEHPLTDAQLASLNQAIHQATVDLWDGMQGNTDFRVEVADHIDADPVAMDVAQLIVKSALAPHLRLIGLGESDPVAVQMLARGALDTEFSELFFWAAARYYLIWREFRGQGESV